MQKHVRSVSEHVRTHMSKVYSSAVDKGTHKFEISGRHRGSSLDHACTIMYLILTCFIIFPSPVSPGFGRDNNTNPDPHPKKQISKQTKENRIESQPHQHNYLQCYLCSMC